MSQKTMMTLAACLTAFVLVMAGGVFARVSGASAASADPAAALSPALRDLWNQREAAYRDLVNQANQRLDAASQTPTTGATALAASQVLNATVSPSDAGGLALMVAPGARIIQQPEIVLFQGITAYEVQTTLGSVYVDVATGQVLYNGAAQMTLAAAPGGWGDHESDDD